MPLNKATLLYNFLGLRVLNADFFVKTLKRVIDYRTIISSVFEDDVFPFHWVR